MKKLIIAAAIVCAAAVSQAAAINWAGEYLYDDAGNVLSTDPGFYLIKLTGTGAGSTAISTGAFEFDDSIPEDLWNSVGGSYELVVGKDKDGDTFQLMATAGAVTDGSGSALVYTLSGFGDDPKSTSVPKFNVSGAVVSSVPEPTSGLLLLLGVAGMALRRRHA